MEPTLTAMGEDILKTALEQVKPSENERLDVKGKVDCFSALLEKATKQEVFVGGSFAKGTWLKGIADVDIFLRYPLSEFKAKSGKLSDLLESKLKVAFKGIERLHGSRDYFRVEYQGLRFEVVPILSIKKANEAVNITDISPLHVGWVKKHTGPEGWKTVLLLKAFLRANGLYGAESYRRGFSGYVCEILCAHFGGFDELIDAATKWKKSTVIDPAFYYKSSEEATLSLNTSKLGALVLIDPVQATRNAAAALSLESLTLFAKLAREFKKSPSIRFFTKEIIEEGKLRQQHRDKPVVWLTLTPLRGKEDVVGAKLLKVFEHIGDKAEEFGFSIIKRGWEWDKNKRASMWFVFKAELSPEHEVSGPPVSAGAHVKNFRAAHGKCVEKRGRLVAIEKREFTKPLSLLKWLASQEYVKERVSKVDIK